MQFLQDVLSLTVTTTGTFDGYDLIDFAGAKITTSDAAVFGVAKHPSTAIGQDIAVMVIGTARVKAVGEYLVSVVVDLFIGLVRLLPLLVQSSRGVRRSGRVMLNSSSVGIGCR